MSWDTFDREVTSGAYVKLTIGEKVQIQIVGEPTFTDKTWEGGKTDRMICLQVLDLSDGEPKQLDAPVRRAGPLGELRAELRSKGVDIASRAIEIECYAIPHPRRAGARIGKWRIKDLGAASDHGGKDAWSDVGEPSAPAPGEYDGNRESAILGAVDLDDLKALFSAAWISTTDADARARYTEAKDARKAELESGDAVPF